jgi:hypothetical protein
MQREMPGVSRRAVLIKVKIASVIGVLEEMRVAAFLRE